jgi:hypothetical protein
MRDREQAFFAQQRKKLIQGGDKRDQVDRRKATLHQ